MEKKSSSGPEFVDRTEEYKLTILDVPDNEVIIRITFRGLPMEHLTAAEELISVLCYDEEVSFIGQFIGADIVVAANDSDGGYWVAGVFTICS